MKIKFQKSLYDYKYLVMFDLASHLTGVCLWDIQANKPISTDVIEVNKNTDLPVFELYNKLEEYFDKLERKGIQKSSILIYKEAMPVQLRGGSSTVQTFVALARSHAILDFFSSSQNIDIYDYVGVYPISTHSYLKKIRNWDFKHKIEKKDIHDYVSENYNLRDIGFDEADAVFLAKTFCEVKWNKDIDEAEKAVRKHAKELKTQKGIVACENEIQRLEGLKMIPGGN